MPAAANVIYRYDGSFEGFLCCVFASYEYKEVPVKICGPEDGQLSLLFLREILTDPVKAQRVWESVPKKIGKEALGGCYKRLFAVAWSKKNGRCCCFCARAIITVRLL